MVYELNQDYLEILKKTFHKVFVNNDAFSNCFNNNIEKIQILCPTNGYSLTTNQYQCIKKTVKELYEEKLLYVSEIECEEFDNVFNITDPPNYNLKHWKLNLSTSYEEYLKLNINVENVIYSQNGKWGIIISHEEHALIGSSLCFAKKFNEYYPIKKCVENFSEKWIYNKQHYNSNLNWYNDLLDLIL